MQAEGSGGHWYGRLQRGGLFFFLFVLGGGHLGHSRGGGGGTLLGRGVRIFEEINKALDLGFAGEEGLGVGRTTKG